MKFQLSRVLMILAATTAAALFVSNASAQTAGTQTGEPEIYGQGPILCSAGLEEDTVVQALARGTTLQRAQILALTACSYLTQSESCVIMSCTRFEPPAKPAPQEPVQVQVATPATQAPSAQTPAAPEAPAATPNTPAPAAAPAAAQ